MNQNSTHHPNIDLHTLISAYAQGAFPMAEKRNGPLSWYEADPRAILPIQADDPAGAFHVSRSLNKFMRKQPFDIRVDTAFADVIDGCAEPRSDDDETWINPAIKRVFNEAHAYGLAHSVEAWQEDQLVGGVYGLALGAAFFAESMFSRTSNASKVCLVHLVRLLQDKGFTLLDAQFVNPHLIQFGVAEISKKQYHQRLHQALHRDRLW